MWIKELVARLNRKKAEITFDPHLFERAEYRSLDLGKVEEAVRTGSVFEDKCEKPNKISFKRHFGKGNTSYFIITIYHENFIEVKTAWIKKGR